MFASHGAIAGWLCASVCFKFDEGPTFGTKRKLLIAVSCHRTGSNSVSQVCRFFLDPSFPCLARPFWLAFPFHPFPLSPFGIRRFCSRTAHWFVHLFIRVLRSFLSSTFFTAFVSHKSGAGLTPVIVTTCCSCKRQLKVSLSQADRDVVADPWLQDVGEYVFHAAGLSKDSCDSCERKS